MMPIRVGKARISRVEEQRHTVPIAVLVKDAPPIDDILSALPHDYFNPIARSFELVFQSWIVEADGLRILIDPCNGNGRRRPGIPQFENLSTPWLERFSATGIDPTEIDFVFCTHLHCDHCGWNTRQSNGRWIPTFSNAQYLFVEREYARWRNEPEPLSDRAPYNEDVFEESVAPIVEAGLATFIDTPHRISSGLEIFAAPGHTLGHAVLFLTSEGERACFSGDAFHHPAQVHRPELHMGGCDDLSAAIATRQMLAARVEQDRALLIPAHFGHSHCGRVVRAGDGFAFVPQAGA
jgi:glyoxylase-like metal-dependent hydrolase (beta-lactamase superfamily II)